jgi:methylated-DNA-[protein]-cysteine S-methyltransferase
MPHLCFQKKVLNIVKKIPRGKVTSYKEIAKALKNPKASQAVGQALAKNPLPLKIPCHRVIKSNGSLGGYSLGARKKKILLKNEGVKITGKPNNPRVSREFFLQTIK